MSRQPVATARPPTLAPARQTLSPEPPQRLPLARFIRRQLVTVAERDAQRSRLVNVLILALALLTAGTIPGYVGTQDAGFSLGFIGAALVIYLAAMVTNGIFRRTATAAYILVIGGGIALAAEPVSLALGGDAMQAAHASLLLPAVILVAGLLFAPEVTLLVGFFATACTAFAVLYGLSVDPRVGRHDAYLAVVYTLGLQLLAGLVAWLLAQFIYESALQMQRAQELEFAQARLDALTATLAEDEQRLEQAMSALQLAITRAMANDYGARAEVPDGPLAPLADNLNLLLQRYEAAGQAEQRQSRYDAAAVPIIETITRMTESGTPTPQSLPIMTNTPLDSVSVVLSQMHATLSQRIGRIQRLVGDISGVVGLAGTPMEGATTDAQEAQRLAGKLTSDSESLLKATQQQLATVQTVRRLLETVLPPEITAEAGEGDLHRDAAGLDPETAAGLLGLGEDLGVNSPGYTGMFDALAAEDGEGHGVVPLTRPLPAIELENGLLAEGAQQGQAAPSTGELRQDQVEAWRLVTRLERELVQIERALRGVGRDLGHQTRALRSADANIAWIRGALEAIARHTDQLQQLAGAGLPAFGTAQAAQGPASRPLGLSGELGPSSRPQAPAQAQPQTPAPPQPPSPQVPREQPYSPPMPTDREEGTLADLVREMNGAIGEPAPSGGNGQPAAPGGEDSTPAPGSLRASDLISLDGIEGIFGNLDQPGQE